MHELSSECDLSSKETNNFCSTLRKKLCVSDSCLGYRQLAPCSHRLIIYLNKHITYVGHKDW